jgi:hypothetical protein
MEQISITLKGTRPLLQNNVRKVNPLDPGTQKLKEVTSKRKKTDDDYRIIERVEWEVGLYHDTAVGPYTKAEAVERCFQRAASLVRMQAALQRGLLVTALDGSEALPILYRGPRDIDVMWAERDKHEFAYTVAVAVGAKKTPRTRPQFRDWSLEVLAHLDETQCDRRTFEEIVKSAGQYIGIGDRRPRYGRFEVEFGR